MANSTPVVRGCGTRVKGGVYMESALSPWGVPLEWFMVDPLSPLPEGYSVKPRGVQIEEGPNGEILIVDWVGMESYAYPADFMEEVRRAGLSRRVDRLTDFSEWKSDKPVYWLGVHPRVYLENWEELAEMVSADSGTHCPKQEFLEGWSRSEFPEYTDWKGSQYRPIPRVPAGHPLGLTMCSGLLYQTLDKSDDGISTPVPPEILSTAFGLSERTITREMPSFSYYANSLPEGFKPKWSPGFFLKMPLTGLVVVDSPDEEDAIQRTLARIKESELECEVVDE